MSSSMSVDQNLCLGFLAALNVFLELASEFGDGVFHRPSGAVGQATDRRSRNDPYGIRDLQKDIQILKPASASAESFHDFQHPARSLSARRALAAGFMS